jgi:hypothetical protein
MDEDAQLARDLLLARRLKLAVRLVVYPLLIGALVLALHIRHAQASGDDGDPAPVLGTSPAPVVWNGTAGGFAFTAWTSGGRVVGFNGVLPMACRDGGTFDLREHVIERDLRFTGRVATYEVTSSHGVADDGGATVLDERFSAQQVGGVVAGTWQGSVLWTRADTGRVVRCDAAPIHLTLEREGADGNAPATWRGRTEAGDRVAVTMRAGRVTRVWAAMRLTCPDGRHIRLTRTIAGRRIRPFGGVWTADVRGSSAAAGDYGVTVEERSGSDMAVEQWGRVRRRRPGRRGTVTCGAAGILAVLRRAA